MKWLTNRLTIRRAPFGDSANRTVKQATLWRMWRRFGRAWCDSKTKNDQMVSSLKRQNQKRRPILTCEFSKPLRLKRSSMLFEKIDRPTNLSIHLNRFRNLKLIKNHLASALRETLLSLIFRPAEPREAMSSSKSSGRWRTLVLKSF